MCVKRFLDSSTLATGGLPPSADHTRFTQQRPWTSQLGLLKQAGLVETWVGGRGVETAFLLPQGRNLAEEFENARQSVPERRRQLRHDYLYWLHEMIEGQDRHPTPDDFLASAPRYLGEPYTEADLERVGGWLKEQGFIAGQSAWQYAAPLRPSLTAKGVWTVENGRSPNDPPPAAQNFTTFVSGDANVSNCGTNVIQNLAKGGEWVSSAAELLDSVQQAAPSFYDSAELVDLIREARAAIEESTPKPKKVRRALGAVGDFLGRAGSGALGGVLAKQVFDLLGSIP